MIYKLLSCSPNLRVDYHASKPTESVVYCFIILYWEQSIRIVFAYHISARPAQFEVSERVLGVSEGLEPRAPEISERKVNSTTNTIASEMEKRVIHL